jgi:hypothetical protein
MKITYHGFYQNVSINFKGVVNHVVDMILLCTS